MKGFFDATEFKTPSYKSDKGMLTCVSCGLYKHAKSPKMKPYGKFKKQIMIIGEAPAEEADEKGKPWQGKMGRILQRKYKQLGIDIFEDCINLYAVNCRPIDKQGGNRTPTEHEVACCRRNVFSAVNEYKPNVIILHGGAAVSSLITHRWKGSQAGVMTWRGWTIPDRELNAWVCPTFHPSFIEKQGEDNEVEVIWTQDLQKALDCVGVPMPDFKDENECIVVEEDAAQVLRAILKQKPSLLAFDIETTGLKPYNKKDHQIVSISFCWENNRAYAIPFPTDKKNLRRLKRILEHPDIDKVAQNMKYEDNWLTFLHGIEVNPWTWDTMQAAHILDNRPHITGLKFQSYVHFGLMNYEQDVAPYLKSEAPNTPNKILDLVKDAHLFRKLLLYNGIDSLMTYRLALLQVLQMEREWK